jgi:hypothetical protein
MKMTTVSDKAIGGKARGKDTTMKTTPQVGGQYCDGFAQVIAGQQPAGSWTAWLAVAWYPSRYDTAVQTAIVSFP